MTTIEAIIEYFRTASGGVVSVSKADAAEIINIVLNSRFSKNPHAIAKLYQFNPVLEAYSHVYTRETTDEAVKAAVIEALQRPPAMNFYMWECYNSDGEFEGKIFTVNLRLF